MSSDEPVIFGDLVGPWWGVVDELLFNVVECCVDGGVFLNSGYESGSVSVEDEDVGVRVAE